MWIMCADVCTLWRYTCVVCVHGVCVWTHEEEHAEMLVQVNPLCLTTELSCDCCLKGNVKPHSWENKNSDRKKTCAGNRRAGKCGTSGGIISR